MNNSFAIKTQLFCLIAILIFAANIYASNTVSGMNTVTGVTEFASKRDTASIGEVIGIKMLNGDSLSQYTILLINGLAVPNLKPIYINSTNNTIYFKLDDNIRYLLTQFIGKTALNKIIVNVQISVTKSMQNSKAYGDIPFFVSLHPRVSKYWILAVAIPVLFLIVMAMMNNLLKEDKNVYYSLGRSQLFYWTLIFWVSYLYIWFATETLPDITGSVLAILGISVSTLAAGKVIENGSKDKQLSVFDNPINSTENKSEGFLMDILSDGSSINIHRFQSVLFNITFGIIFIQKAFSSLVLPEFDANALLLMGISAGTYTGLKITEQKNISESTKTSTAINNGSVG